MDLDELKTKLDANNAKIMAEPNVSDHVKNTLLNFSGYMFYSQAMLNTTFNHNMEGTLSQLANMTTTPEFNFNEDKKIKPKY